MIPGNIAFKFVTILGSVTLPVAAWAFGRLAGLARPRPALLAAFTLPFLFDQTYQIYGGNLLSTMAGEYAYSLGLSVAVLFLGVVALRAEDRTPQVGWARPVADLCRVPPRSGDVRFGRCGDRLLARPTFEGGARGGSCRRSGVGALLNAWWWVPFILQQSFTTSMGYTNVRDLRRHAVCRSRTVGRSFLRRGCRRDRGPTSPARSDASRRARDRVSARRPVRSAGKALQRTFPPAVVPLRLPARRYHRGRGARVLGEALASFADRTLAGDGRAYACLGVDAV